MELLILKRNLYFLRLDRCVGHTISMTQSFRMTPTILVKTRWCNWLRHCDISRKVAGSSSDGVIEIFLLL